MEISSLVSYLASKEAHFITGQSVSLALHDCLAAKLQDLELMSCFRCHAMVERSSIETKVMIHFVT